MTDTEVECLASIGLAAIVWFSTSDVERECVEAIDRADKQWQDTQNHVSQLLSGALDTDLYWSQLAAIQPARGLSQHQQPFSPFGSLLGGLGL